MRVSQPTSGRRKVGLGVVFVRGAGPALQGAELGHKTIPCPPSQKVWGPVALILAGLWARHKAS